MINPLNIGLTVFTKETWMSSQQSKIKQVFESLLESDGGTGQRVHSRIDHAAPVNIYAARTFPEKSIILEVGPIDKAYLPEGFRRPRIKGLDITVEHKQKAIGGDITLLLELQQIDAIDVFSTFASRVCEEMNSLENTTDAVRAVFSLIDRWKDFFAGNSDFLSAERQTGLYGELHLITRLYKVGIPLCKLINAWTGSKSTCQDFEFGAISIEVKSTVAVDSSTVKVANIRQLDTTGIDLLFLNHVLFDARQGTEYTLPKLICELRETIASHAPEVGLEFEEKVLLAKYRNNHSEHYGNRTYTERALNFYEVKEGFPHLVESELPVGVTNASYEIMLEHCKPYEQVNQTVFELMREYCD